MKFAVPSVLAAAAIWANIAIPVNHMTLQGLSVMHLIAFRGFFAALLMLFYILCRDTSLLRIQWRDLWMFAGMGIVSFTFFNYCLFHAFSLIGVSLSVALMYTSPIFVALFARIFFKEPINRRKGISLALSVLGCVLVTGVLQSSVTADVKGIFFAVASGLFYGLYSIFGTVTLSRYSFSTTLFYTFVFTFISGVFLSDMGAFATVVSRQPTLLLWGFLLGVGFTILPFGLYTYGLSHLGPSKAAVLATAEPMVATVMSWFVYDERLSLFQAAGILTIILAVILISVEFKKPVIFPQ